MAMPTILPHDSAALGIRTIQLPLHFALDELVAHPGEGLEEDVGAGEVGAAGVGSGGWDVGRGGWGVGEDVGGGG